MLDVGINNATTAVTGKNMKRRGYPCSQWIWWSNPGSGSAPIVVYDRGNGSEIARISAVAGGGRQKVDFPSDFRVDLETPTGDVGTGINVRWDA